MYKINHCFRVLHLIPAFLWLVFCFAAEMFQWKILSVLEFKLFGMWELDYIVFWALVIGAAVYLLMEIIRWCRDTCEPVTSFIRNHVKFFAELFKTKKREDKTHILKR